MPQKKTQTEKKDKRYRTKIVLPGLDKPVWLSAKTKRELEDKRREVEEEYVNGKPPEDIPFVDLVSGWWTVVKEPTVKREATRRQWERTLRLWVYPCFNPRKMSRAVTRADLQACLNHAAGRSFNLVSHIKSCLTGACRYGMSERILTADPSGLLTFPALSKPTGKRPFTRVEEERILAAAAKLGGMEQAFILLLYYTGMRRGEAAGLQWQDILWKRQLIHVQRDIDYSVANTGAVDQVKTTVADRYIPIPAPLLAWLKTHRGLPTHFVLTGDAEPVTSATGFRLINRVMAECGYYDKKPGVQRDAVWPSTDIIPWFSAHYFRHHYITSCVQADFRPEYIMGIVGHASYTTTIKTYTHIQHQMLEDDYKSTHLSDALSKMKVAKKLPEQTTETQII